VNSAGWAAVVVVLCTVVPGSVGAQRAAAASPAALLAGGAPGGVELLAEAPWVRLRSEADEERDRYRDLAFTVARAPFTPAGRDTVFEYFEQMERFVDSGPFDTDPGPALTPTNDETTFNGSIWKLARETFLADPTAMPDTASVEYRRALDFYRRRAVGPNFRWSWRNAGLEQDLFRQSIRKSDDAFRSARQYLGLVLVNHLMSAVDAFVSERLSAGRDAVSISSSLRWPAAGRGSVLVGLGIGIRF
jgi:hypothetical protein